MRRRVQGQIYRRNGENDRQETGSLRCASNDEITISKDQLVSGIIDGLTKKAENSGPTDEDRLATEISEELINSVAAKVEERQKQNKQAQEQEQGQNNGQQGNKPQNNQQNKIGNKDSERTQLQALVAKLLLGEKSKEQKQSANDSNQDDNPILTGLDNCLQSGTGENLQKKNSSQNDLTAEAAAQVLAESQYELAKELEASLQKLRQVIEESKHVSQKINDLLGQKDPGGSGDKRKK